MYYYVMCQMGERSGVWSFILGDISYVGVCWSLVKIFIKVTQLQNWDIPCLICLNYSKLRIMPKRPENTQPLRNKDTLWMVRNVCNLAGQWTGKWVFQTRGKCITKYNYHLLILGWLNFPGWLGWCFDSLCPRGISFMDHCLPRG